MRGIHPWLVHSPHKGMWRGALMFSLIGAWIKELSKYSRHRWFETPQRSLWRHFNNEVITEKDLIWRETLSHCYNFYIYVYVYICLHTSLYFNTLFLVFLIFISHIVCVIVSSTLVHDRCSLGPFYKKISLFPSDLEVILECVNAIGRDGINPVGSKQIWQSLIEYDNDL